MASSPLPPLSREDLEHVLEHTASLWEPARGRSFFITGGTGFFGKWLLESFTHINGRLALGMRAAVLTRNPGAFKSQMPHLATRTDLEWIPGDVRTLQSPAHETAYILHAGTTSSAPVEPREMFDTVVEGTQRVLEFAERSQCQKMLFVSSGAVYGKQPPDLAGVPETHSGAPDPLDPNAAYGEGKRAAELLCAIAASKPGLDVKIARCFAFLGPHLPLDAHFAAGNFIRNVLRGEPIRVRGDGTAVRSYLYMADLAIWLWTLLFSGRRGAAYNVGSGEAYTIKELAHSAAGLSKPPLPVVVETPETPGSKPARYIPNVKRATEELGLKVRIPLREGLQRTLDWNRGCAR